MDFSLSEEQSQIRDLTKQILADHCHDEFQMAFSKKLLDPSSPRYSVETWKLLAESGLLGTAVPEAHGGSGFGLVELCQMLEEQGRHVAPIPLLHSLVLGGLILSRYGSTEQQNHYLPSLAQGEAILTAAVAEESMALALRNSCTAQASGSAWQLNGLRVAVPYAAEAAAILVCAEVNQQQALFLVAANAAGMQCDFANSGNHEPFYRVSFNNTPAQIIGSLEQGRQIINDLLNYGAIASCAIMVGLTEEAMKRTAQYTTERKQFETSIASFQNTSMKIADCYIDVEALRSSYYEALWKLSEGIDCDAEIKVAKYWACGAGHRVTHICQHLHGGIGADIEFPLLRYYLWFKQMDLSFGGGSKQLADLGALISKNPSINLLSNLA